MRDRDDARIASEAAIRPDNRSGPAASPLSGRILFVERVALGGTQLDSSSAAIPALRGEEEQAATLCRPKSNVRANFASILRLAILLPLVYK